MATTPKHPRNHRASNPSLPPASVPAPDPSWASNIHFEFWVMEDTITGSLMTIDHDGDNLWSKQPVTLASAKHMTTQEVVQYLDAEENERSRMADRTGKRTVMPFVARKVLLTFSLQDGPDTKMTMNSLAAARVRIRNTLSEQDIALLNGRLV